MRRYESASAFAQDIQRHLNAEPGAGGGADCRLPAGEVHPAQQGPRTVAAAITLLLLAGTAVSTWQAIRATRAKAVADAAVVAKGKALDDATKAKAEAVAAAIEKGTALDEATAANEQAQTRLKQMEKANEIMGSIFDRPRPEGDRPADRPLQAILVEKLDKAVELLQGEAIGDSLEVADMQNRFGAALVGLGEPKKAVVLLEPSPRHSGGEARRRRSSSTILSMGNLAAAYD